MAPANLHCSKHASGAPLCSPTMNSSHQIDWEAVYRNGWCKFARHIQGPIETLSGKSISRDQRGEALDQILHIRNTVVGDIKMAVRNMQSHTPFSVTSQQVPSDYFTVTVPDKCKSLTCALDALLETLESGIDSMNNCSSDLGVSANLLGLYNSGICEGVLFDVLL